MDQDFWDCFGMMKILYNCRNKVMHPKDGDGMANIVDTVCSESQLFRKTCQS